MKDWMQQIQELNRFPSVSGDESCVQAYLREQIEPFCDQIDVDAMGNLIATLGKGIGPRVLFSAYVDTSGLLVRYIRRTGNCWFFRWASAVCLAWWAERLCFRTACPGILETNTTDDQELRGEDFFVDIGVATAQQASEKVPLGTFGFDEAGILCWCRRIFFNGFFFNQSRGNRFAVVADSFCQRESVAIKK